MASHSDASAQAPLPALAGIRACVFDAYGTMFDVAAAAARERAALGAQAQPLAQLWRQKQLEYTWLRSLMGAYADFWQLTGDALDYALDSLGIADPALRDRLLDLYSRLDAYPEVPGVLAALRKGGLACAILSNGAPAMLASAVANAGVGDMLAATLSVDGLRIYKPDPRVYQLAVDRLGVAASEICFLSSNAWDVAGSAHFGFRAVWVNRFGQPAERLPGRPVAELRDLAGLPALLGLG
ncbi:MAG: haloacid dehalogenase type II [Alphaproteobacteria bacterium]